MIFFPNFNYHWYLTISQRKRDLLAWGVKKINKNISAMMLYTLQNPYNLPLSLHLFPLKDIRFLLFYNAIVTFHEVPFCRKKRKRVLLKIIKREKKSPAMARCDSIKTHVLSHLLLLLFLKLLHI